MERFDWSKLTKEVRYDQVPYSLMSRVVLYGSIGTLALYLLIDRHNIIQVVLMIISSGLFFWISYKMFKIIYSEDHLNICYKKAFKKKENQWYVYEENVFENLERKDK